jgi:hypothetical protein
LIFKILKIISHSSSAPDSSYLLKTPKLILNGDDDEEETAASSSSSADNSPFPMQPYDENSFINSSAFLDENYSYGALFKLNFIEEEIDNSLSEPLKINR